MSRATVTESMEIEHDGEQDMEATTGSHLLSGLLFTLAVLGLLGFGTFKVMDPSTLPVRHVSVTGDFVHLSPFSLEQRASDVVRGGFFNVNVDTIKQTLMQEPWVKEVSVKRIWPDRITVTIREQTAIARWGQTGLMNPEAEIFYPDPATIPETLPMVSGPDNSSRLVLDNFFDLQEMLPEQTSLQELNLSDRRSWELKLESGPVLRIGKTDVISRVERFLEYFPVHELETPGKILYIDMRYTNGFAVRWNTEPESEAQPGQENYGEKI